MFVVQMTRPPCSKAQPMRFIITAQPDPARTPADAPGGFDAELFQAYMRFNEEMHQAGVLVASEGLNPAAPGARVIEV